MNGFKAFLKKEFLEQIRTYKVLILFSVLIIFGMTSPLFAKLMPKILASMPANGVQITMKNPTYLDAYTQFFKNVSQIGMLVMLLVFSGILSSEITKGTLINMLSKGLTRDAVIISKYIAALTLWTFSYALSAAISYGYTIYLFGNHSVNNLLLSLFCLWVFGAFIIAIILFASTITRGNYGGLLLTILIIAILMIADIFPWSIKFNPIALASNNMGIISGSVKIGNVQINVILSVAITMVCLILSILNFRKKQI